VRAGVIHIVRAVGARAGQMDSVGRTSGVGVDIDGFWNTPALAMDSLCGSESRWPSSYESHRLRGMPPEMARLETSTDRG